MEPANIPFYFEAIRSSIYVSMSSDGYDLPEISLYISYDNASWSEWDLDDKIELAPGERVYFMSSAQGNMDGISSSQYEYRYFVIDAVTIEEDVWDGKYVAKCRAGGNIMSLLSQSFASMTSIPTDYCFAKLFQSCDRMVEAPDLRASIMSNGCYEGMFCGCSNLSSQPSLEHVVELGDSCFANMFADCTKISGSALLPVSDVVVKERCYECMFSCCKNLETINRLRFSSSMEYRCFDSMFYGCEMLKDEIFEEDAITGFVKINLSSVSDLAESCFSYMFSECTGIMCIPEMPTVAQMQPYCYDGMFAGCYGINTISGFNLPSEMAEGCCRNMFSGCSGILSENVSSVLFSDVTKLAEECFQNMFSNCTGLTVVPEMPGYGNASFKLAYSCYAYMFSGCSEIVSVDGMSVPSAMEDGCFSGMFYGCSKITSQAISSAGMLLSSVTSLADGCFSEMFAYCKGLTSFPQLPSVSVELKKDCYSRMFAGCNGITSISTLVISPVVKDGSYREMFNGCSEILSSDMNPSMFSSVTTLGKDCFLGMFQGCTKITSVPQLPSASVELKDSCYAYMFKGCTGLTSSPALPSMSLKPSCYRSMFSGCTSISSVGAVSALIDQSGNGIVRNGSCYGMFYKCTSIPSFPDICAMTLDDYCFSYMFYGCTSLTESPRIKAKTLCKHSLSYMFYGCGGITRANKLDALIDDASGSGEVNEYCCYHMFDSCIYLNEFTDYEMSVSTLAPHCFEYMFANCNSITISLFIDCDVAAAYCFAHMYDSCTFLTTGFFPKTVTAPHECEAMYKGCIRLYNAHMPYGMPTEVSECCYYEMFSGCNSLSDPFQLPATTLAPYCYCEMYRDCFNIENIPRLPATTMASHCYDGMFYGCYKSYGGNDYGIEYVEPGKVAAFDDPNATLSDSCFKNMFYGCKKLREIPPLKARTLAVRCYENMFGYCTNLFLVQRDAIQATALSGNSCSSMFSHCSSIKDFIAGNEVWSFDSSAPSGFSYGVIRSRIHTECTYYLVKVPDGYSGGMTIYDLKYFLQNHFVIDEKDGLTSLQEVTFQDLDTPINAVASDSNWPSGDYWRGTWSFSPSAPTEFTYGVVCTSYTVGVVRYADCYLIKAPSREVPEKFLYSELDTYRSKGWVYGDGRKLIPITPSASTTVVFYVPGPNIVATHVSTPVSLSMSLPVQTLSYSCYSHMFEYCTGLTSMPELSATDFSSADYCYAYMFSNCTGIAHIASDALPATVLAYGCYDHMFEYCTGLTNAGAPSGLSNRIPNLPATDLSGAPYCYRGMFFCCTNLVKAPTISATVLSTSCFDRMFTSCTSLYDLSGINFSGVTKMASNCCYAMFEMCRALTSAPNLMLCEFAPSCYERMFMSCENITSAPALTDVAHRGRALKYACFRNMFSSCYALTDTSALNLWRFSVLAQSCCENMFTNSGILKAVSLPGNMGIWPNAEISCYKYMFSNCISMEIDNTDNSYGGKKFFVPLSSTARECCMGMFYGCNKITKVSNPLDPSSNIINGIVSHVTELSNYCFDSMFRSCSELSVPPVLPGASVRLAEGCYKNMFSECYALTDAPKLPALNLAFSCYESMFSSCKGLTTAPELPAVQLYEKCYQSMFNYCPDLQTAPDLPAETLEPYCYSYMFYYCNNVSFNHANIGAKKSAAYAMYRMFYYCYHLTSIRLSLMKDPEYPYAYEDWAYYVGSNGRLLLPEGSEVIDMLPNTWSIEYEGSSGSDSSSSS